MEKVFKSVKLDIRCTPVLDPDYIPFTKFYEAFLKTVTEPIAVSIERENAQVQVFKTKIQRSTSGPSPSLRTSTLKPSVSTPSRPRQS